MDHRLPSTIRASTYFGNDGISGTMCSVSVNGQVVSLTLTGTVCPGSSFAQMSPVATQASASCLIPSLPDGRYSVAGITDSVFTIPADPSDTLRSCL